MFLGRSLVLLEVFGLGAFAVSEEPRCQVRLDGGGLPGRRRAECGGSFGEELWWEPCTGLKQSRCEDGADKLYVYTTDSSLEHRFRCLTD